MTNDIPRIRFRVSDGDSSYFLWVPRRVLIVHLNRDADGDWVPATYAATPRSRGERMEGHVTLRDLADGRAGAAPRSGGGLRARDTGVSGPRPR